MAGAEGCSRGTTAVSILDQHSPHPCDSSWFMVWWCPSINQVNPIYWESLRPTTGPPNCHGYTTYQVSTAAAYAVTTLSCVFRPGITTPPPPPPITFPLLMIQVSISTIDEAVYNEAVQAYHSLQADSDDYTKYLPPTHYYHC